MVKYYIMKDFNLLCFENPEILNNPNGVWSYESRVFNESTSEYLGPDDYSSGYDDLYDDGFGPYY